jgi:hypothetical protein
VNSTPRDTGFEIETKDVCGFSLAMTPEAVSVDFEALQWLGGYVPQPEDVIFHPATWRSE